MSFDFEKFAKVVKGTYQGGYYSLQEVLDVFFHYFATYEEYMGKPHPPIRAKQIERIIQAMPYLEKRLTSDQIADILPEDYPALINKHFKTGYRHCDYNINHFFSGRIRELRFYEELY